MKEGIWISIFTKFEKALYWCPLPNILLQRKGKIKNCSKLKKIFLKVPVLLTLWKFWSTLKYPVSDYVIFLNSAKQKIKFLVEFTCITKFVKFVNKGNHKKNPQQTQKGQPRQICLVRENSLSMESKKLGQSTCFWIPVIHKISLSYCL